MWHHSMQICRNVVGIFQQEYVDSLQYCGGMETQRDSGSADTSAASAAFSLCIVWRMLFAFALYAITFSTQLTPHAPVVRSRTGTLA